MAEEQDQQKCTFPAGPAWREFNQPGRLSLGPPGTNAQIRLPQGQPKGTWRERSHHALAWPQLPREGRTFLRLCPLAEG